MELNKPNTFFFWPRFIVLFLLFFSLLFSVFYFYKYSENEINVNKIKSEQKAIIAAQKKYISMTLDSIGQDLLLLSDFIEIHHAYNIHNKKLIELTEANALALSLRKGLYDQLRYIDLQGNEIIRVNYNDGDPSIVPKAQLQNKANRYYVKDSLKLHDGDVYISALDLNIEHGEIEIPHKPMLRLATPVYDDSGKKRGIVILNYLAEHLLDGLKIFNLNQNDHHMLINHNDYFLFYDRRPELEFAFMFPNNEGKKYSTIYPKTYRCLNHQESGQFDISSGVLTFDSVFSYPKNIDSSSSIHIVKQDTCWRLVTFVPNSTKWTLTNTSSNDLHILSSMLLFSLCMSYIITQLQFKKRIDHNEIRKLAHHDSLTGLINRGYFKKLFHWKMQHARRFESKLALIYIDLDGFKNLNDSFGHSVGDLALKAISKNLEYAFSINAYVSRIGGDEFAVLIYDVNDTQEVISQVEAYLYLSHQPLTLDNKQYMLNTSIGVAFFPEHGTNINDLMHNADEAMYYIKRSGKNGFQIFSL
ncbi:diguanylate cyclase domain-containing protein [Aliivibrio salmonicida]|uniref:cache domain-containing protein n=1 Tax=Aliivibrio salmonicida TaxID=40269 RepID=UPI003D0C1400